MKHAAAHPASVLELVIGVLPFAHGGRDGEWRYRHAVRPEGATALDYQAVADFLAYETAHGRAVRVVADSGLGDWETWPVPVARPHPRDFATQCCTHVYRDGCAAALVCHGAPAAVAAQILAEGALVTPGAERAATSTWGEPADYFDHVMFANGRCTAPEAVALSRAVGRDLVPADLTAGYPPAVRFYFDWATLVTRTDAVFDGVHPVKIRDRIELDDALVAVVAHTNDRARLEPDERLIFLDIDNPRPEEWATAALGRADRPPATA